MRTLPQLIVASTLVAGVANAQSNSEDPPAAADDASRAIIDEESGLQQQLSPSHRSSGPVIELPDWLLGEPAEAGMGSFDPSCFSVFPSCVFGIPYFGPIAALAVFAVGFAGVLLALPSLAGVALGWTAGFIAAKAMGRKTLPFPWLAVFGGGPALLATIPIVVVGAAAGLGGFFGLTTLATPWNLAAAGGVATGAAIMAAGVVVALSAGVAASIAITWLAAPSVEAP